MAEKATRNRSLVRSYDYDTGKGAVKDASTSQVVQAFDIDEFTPQVVRKLALSKAMDLIAGAGVDAVRDGEDALAAMLEVHTDLKQDQFEFRDGVGIAMGGTIKRVARALVELGKTYVLSPDGRKLSFSAGNLNEAYAALKVLWDVPADEKRVNDATTNKESGRTRFNRIKAVPAIAEKLASYGKKAAAPSGDSMLG